MNRWHVLGPALAAAAGLLLFADPPAPSVVVNPTVSTSARAETPPKRARSTPDSDAVVPALLDRHVLYPMAAASGAARDLFADLNRAVDAPVPSAEPLKVGPPDLPFVYVGKKQEAGEWEVFLSKSEMTWVVKEGQLVENVYQVVKIAPPVLTMVYLPMNHLQTLPIGEAE